MIELDRRTLLKTGVGLGISLVIGKGARAGDPIYLADMHRHLWFNRLQSGEARPLGPDMAEGNATLVAWALGADVHWIAKGPRGFVQTAVPLPGEGFGWFTRELARIKQHIAGQKLKAIENATDVTAALAGIPHVVLATEGSLYLEDDISRVQTAYDLGVRHIQLVHFTKNPIGDFQTERPEHNGLTDFGKRVISECNRLGILVDLAHATERAVDEALEISKAPVIWSHSSIASGATPDWTMIGWKARQLTLKCAQRIARKGGVVGLWTERVDVGKSTESYAERLLAMSDQIGEDHVGFGTDMSGDPFNDKDFMMTSYSDLRKVVDYWRNKGVNDKRMRKIAIGNYARVLQDALQPRQVEKVTRSP
jgi:membrane dipeptidase